MKNTKKWTVADPAEIENCLKVSIIHPGGDVEQLSCLADENELGIPANELAALAAQRPTAAYLHRHPKHDVYVYWARDLETALNFECENRLF